MTLAIIRRYPLFDFGLLFPQGKAIFTWYAKKEKELF